MNGKRDYEYSGTVGSLSAVDFTDTKVPYFSFGLDNIEETPKPDRVFLVDVSRPTSQPIVAAICAAFNSQVKIKIRQDPAAPRQVVNWVQVSNPPRHD